MTALLDTAQIAEMLGVSREHVTARVTKHPDFPMPLSKRPLTWRAADVAAYLCPSEPGILLSSPAAQPKPRDPRAQIESHLRTVFHNTSGRAARDGREFSISMPVVLEMLRAQGWRCAVSKVEFTMDRPVSRAAAPYGPSIDRINSAIGYTDTNIRLVCCCVNMLMNVWGDSVYKTLFVQSATNAWDPTC